MQDQIAEQLKAISFKEVTVKDSKGHTNPMYLSDRSLVLIDSTRKNLYVLTPIGPYTHSGIEVGTYVMAEFVYRIDKIIHITKEQDFLDTLEYEPPKRFDFKIEVDGKTVYQSNQPYNAKKKLKSIVKSRKNPKEDHFGCKKIEFFEPNGKVTTFVDRD